MSIRLSRARGPLALAAVAALFSLAPASAQLEYGGAPYTADNRLESSVPTEAMPEVDVLALQAEDALRTKNQPFRFGDAIEVDLSMANSGVWDEFADGSRVWRLRIASEGAYSLSFLFSRYQVPMGGELFVYNDDHGTVRGAYTHENHNEDGQFAIQPIQGDAVTFEYYEPAGVDAPGEIRICSVIHDYTDIFSLYEKSGGGAKAGWCENDVACPEGDPWWNQINATTLIILGGYLCSGSLINNTAHDGDQLYISAYHCGSMNSAVFRFNYERSGCGSGSAPTNHTVQGSVQLAANSSRDTRLARITPTIPLSYDPVYAGWDRTDVAPSDTVATHHPQGGVKKISFDYDSPVKSGNDWRIVQWDDGVTEPGSSGSPLYTPQGRFIGALYGGQATCDYPYNDYYPRLSKTWAYVGPYLDPLGTGETTIDHYDPNGGSDPTAEFIGSPTSGYTPLDVDFTDQSTGTGLHTWAWTFGDGGTSGVRHPSYTYTLPGTFTVTLTVTGTNGNDTRTRTGYITVSTGSGASVSSRNGSGVNPDIYSSTDLPVLGTTWTAQIDGGSVGASGLTFTVGYSAPLIGVMTAIGELLIDISSPWMLTNIAGGGSSISYHNILIPNDPAFVGLPVFMQGLLNNLGGVAQLTNALDLILGT